MQVYEGVFNETGVIDQVDFPHPIAGRSLYFHMSLLRCGDPAFSISVRYRTSTGSEITASLNVSTGQAYRTGVAARRLTSSAYYTRVRITHTLPATGLVGNKYELKICTGFTTCTCGATLAETVSLLPNKACGNCDYIDPFNLFGSGV